MKKLVVFMGVLALFVGTTSCKKDWICTCSDSAYIYLTEPIEDATKEDAQAECDELDDLFKGTLTTCSLD